MCSIQWGSHILYPGNEGPLYFPYIMEQTMFSMQEGTIYPGHVAFPYSANNETGHIQYTLGQSYLQYTNQSLPDTDYFGYR